MDWFLHDNGLRYERVKKYLMFHSKVKKESSPLFTGIEKLDITFYNSSYAC